jgi:hypothetical protein
MSIFLIKAILLIGFFYIDAGYGQNIIDVKEKYPTSHPMLKSLIVEQVLVYKISTYTPPVILDLSLTSKLVSFESPEEAVKAHFSAMVQKNFPAFMETWTKESQVLISKRNLDLNRSEVFLINAWGKALAGQTIELTSKVEYDKYIIIGYRMIPDHKEDKIFEDSVALVKQNNQWKLTQELAADPILMYWHNPIGRVQIVPDVPFKTYQGMPIKK